MAVRATGNVTRLFVRSEGVNIRLQVSAELAPLDGYFSLELSHANYQALYSLALAAAMNGYPLTIRTRNEITPDEIAIVEYMVVDW
jgi:hypothetical protein